MWQPTWSPHQPQGALQGQQASATGFPFQGISSCSMGAHHMSHQQPLGLPAVRHGCQPGSMGPPNMGQLPLPGHCGQSQTNLASSLGTTTPGHQGFSVQYKHHQGCHSSIQGQQMMSLPAQPSPLQPMAPCHCSHHGGLEGVPSQWPTQPFDPVQNPPWNTKPVPLQPFTTTTSTGSSTT